MTKEEEVRVRMIAGHEDNKLRAELIGRMRGEFNALLVTYAGIVAAAWAVGKFIRWIIA